MKSQLVRKISNKYILPHLPEFKIQGHLLYHRDIQYLLRGFYFESSAFSSTSFTIEVFVQPLYIPDDTIILTFGNRLGNIAKQRDIWWDYHESREDEISSEVLSLMMNSGIPYLEERRTLEKFTNHYKNLNPNANKHMIEAICYALILINDYQKAKKQLVSLERVLAQDILKYPGISWIKDIQIRVQLILGYLKNRDYEGAKQQLNEWRDSTLLNLGLG